MLACGTCGMMRYYDATFSLRRFLWPHCCFLNMIKDWTWVLRGIPVNVKIAFISHIQLIILQWCSEECVFKACSSLHFSVSALDCSQGGKNEIWNSWCVVGATPAQTAHATGKDFSKRVLSKALWIRSMRSSSHFEKVPSHHAFPLLVCRRHHFALIVAQSIRKENQFALCTNIRSSAAIYCNNQHCIIFYHTLNILISLSTLFSCLCFLLCITVNPE